MLFHKSKKRRQLLPLSPGPAPLLLSPPLALPPQQLAIDVGDLLQVVLQLVVVLDPAAHLGQVFLSDDAARRATPAQSNGQIPHRAMPLTASTLARRVATSHITLDQRIPAESRREAEPTWPILAGDGATPIRRDDVVRYLPSFKCKPTSEKGNLQQIRIWQVRISPLPC